MGFIYKCGQAEKRESEKRKRRDGSRGKEERWTKNEKSKKNER